MIDRSTVDMYKAGWAALSGEWDVVADILTGLDGGDIAHLLEVAERLADECHRHQADVPEVTGERL